MRLVIPVEGWSDLPPSVRSAVTDHTGPVFSSDPVRGGQNNDLAVVLTTAGEPVFVKGVQHPGRRMRMLRNEISAGRLAAGIAPEVLFAEEIDGWLVVGFRYVTGRPADLSPDSPDLNRVAQVVNRIATLPAPVLRPLQDRWNRLDYWHSLAGEAPETVNGWDVPAMSEWAQKVPRLVHGGQLVHTDLHGSQFILSDDGSTHVVDWGFPASGAPWVDSAFLTLRLVEAGHTPAEAEAWARRSLTSIAEISENTLTAWAVHLAGMWGYWAAMDDEDGKQHRARLARDYLTWRLRNTGHGSEHAQP